jgi:ABC-2 type transport system ATP-binding protein
MEEVEQICTRIAIMDKGSKIAEGTTEELKRMIKNTETITAEILQLPENVREQIEALEHVYNVSYADNKLVARCTGGRHNLIEILKILQENQVGFGSVYSEQPTLNDVFLEITGKALRDKE